MQKISLVHFQPLEHYPPVMNFIRYFEKQRTDLALYVYTTRSMAGLPAFETESDQVRIRRFDAPATGANIFSKLLKYSRFYFGILCALIRMKPAAILYYETLSSFPASFYRKYLDPTLKLFIHYHEYTSPSEYEKGMWLTRRFHRREKQIYSLADWVSHTNDDRMRKFVEDNPGLEIPNRHILPNYPPKSWYRERKSICSSPVRLIYIGALSLDTMYTKELAEWVLIQGGKFTWDIYASNITPDAKAYLDSIATKSSLIRFHGGIDYFSLPQILANFDVGLILYKGHIQNYIYNVPNKLFEYHTSGLDCWFPDSMISSLPLATSDSYPKIVKLDFNKLAEIDPVRIIDRNNLEYRPNLFFAENVLKDLYQKMEASTRQNREG